MLWEEWGKKRRVPPIPEIFGEMVLYIIKFDAEIRMGISGFRKSDRHS